VANSLEKDIFRTLAYFSYFTYPLTSFEIWKWQLDPEMPRSYEEITNALENSTWLANFLAYKDGFWGVYWKTVPIEEQIAERHRRNINAFAKHRKLKRVLKYLSRIPWVKGIAICNTLAWHHTEPRSDIDLFLIVDDRRVWSTRLFAVAPLALLSQRPGETIEDPIDISFFVTEASMNLEHLKITNDDPYLAVWTRSLLPVYGKDLLWDMWRAENRWSEKTVPAAAWRRGSLRLTNKKKSKWRIPISEAFARQLQLKRLPEELRDLANKDSRVVVADHILKFHKNDRRQEIQNALIEAMKLCEI